MPGVINENLLNGYASSIFLIKKTIKMMKIVFVNLFSNLNYH